MFQGRALEAKMRQMCNAFHAALYTIPIEAEQRSVLKIRVTARLSELNDVLTETKNQQKAVLGAAVDGLEVNLIRLRKARAVYHVLNGFNYDSTTKIFLGEAWAPEVDLGVIREAMQKVTNEGAADRYGNSAFVLCQVTPLPKNPPTYFRTNKFTKAFQSIVNSYGVPTYREVNPALYTIITFPFLFAVMFGDFVSFGLALKLKIMDSQGQCDLFFVSTALS